MFRDNRMIAVCQNVPLSAEDKLLLRHQLRKHKILVKVFPNQVGQTPGRDAPLPLHLGGYFCSVVLPAPSPRSQPLTWYLNCSWGLRGPWDCHLCPS